VAATIEKCFSGLQEKKGEEASQRQALLAVEKTKADAEVERGDWKEYHEASVQFLQYKKSEEDAMLITLLGRRINMLEEKLKIPIAKSVTKGTIIEREHRTLSK